MSGSDCHRFFKKLIPFNDKNTILTILLSFQTSFYLFRHHSDVTSTSLQRHSTHLECPRVSSEIKIQFNFSECFFSFLPGNFESLQKSISDQNSLQHRPRSESFRFKK